MYLQVAKFDRSRCGAPAVTEHGCRRAALPDIALRSAQPPHGDRK